jgi:hypothetical protein
MGTDSKRVEIYMRGCLTEQLIELFQAPLLQFLFAERLTQGHIGDVCFLLLHLQEPLLDRVFDNVLDRDDRAGLTKTMLW